MTFLKRNCPACGNLTLPVLSRSRRKKRSCSECGAEFVEFPASGCLVYPVILSIAFGSLFLGALIPEVLADSGALPYIILTFFILGFAIPGYFLSATIPLRLSRHRDNEGKKMEFRDRAYRFPLVLIILALLAVLSLRNCSESFFPGELRELASKRESLLPEFRKVLLAYKKDHDCYPDDLDALIPNYTDALPPELDPARIWKSKLYDIHYYSSDCEAIFGWSRCNGPDCRSSFLVEKDEFWHDM